MIEFMHEKKILSFFFLVLLSTDEFRIVLLALLFQDRAFSWEAIRYMQKTYFLSRCLRSWCGMVCGLTVQKGSQTPVCLALASAPSVRDRHARHDRIKRQWKCICRMSLITALYAACSHYKYRICINFRIRYLQAYSTVPNIYSTLESPWPPPFYHTLRILIQEFALGWRRISSIPGTSHSCNRDTASPSAMSRIRRFPGEIWRGPLALE